MAPALPQFSPSSNSSACPAVRTSTAWPRPTSNTVAAKPPCGWLVEAGTVAGRSASSAVTRIQGRHGNRATATATAASRYHHVGGAARSNASGLPAAARNTGHVRPISNVASLNSPVASVGQAPRATVAPRINGTSNRLNTGIASRLTARPAIETEPNTAMVTGTRAAVTCPWVRSMARQPCRASGVSAPCSSNAPTARKDSQKPAASGASGSSSSTPTRPLAKVRAAGRGRAAMRRPCQVASISRVRCVGTDQPASSA